MARKYKRKSNGQFAGGGGGSGGAGGGGSKVSGKSGVKKPADGKQSLPKTSGSKGPAKKRKQPVAQRAAGSAQRAGKKVRKALNSPLGRTMQRAAVKGAVLGAVGVAYSRSSAGKSGAAFNASAKIWKAAKLANQGVKVNGGAGRRSGGTRVYRVSNVGRN